MDFNNSLSPTRNLKTFSKLFHPKEKIQKGKWVYYFYALKRPEVRKQKCSRSHSRFMSKCIFQWRINGTALLSTLRKMHALTAQSEGCIRFKFLCTYMLGFPWWNSNFIVTRGKGHNRCGALLAGPEYTMMYKGAASVWVKRVITQWKTTHY